MRFTTTAGDSLDNDKRDILTERKREGKYMAFSSRYPRLAGIDPEKLLLLNDLHHINILSHNDFLTSFSLILYENEREDHNMA